MKQLLVMIFLLGINVVHAAINPVEFETEDQYERYKILIAELRCLVCQNQNLADSNADLALDLKNIVQQKILEGQTDTQILDFMTQRYGDFVLYRPPVKSKTLLLWLGPLLFLLVGLVIIFAFIRKTKTQSVKISQQDLQKVKKMLENTER